MKKELRHIVLFKIYPDTPQEKIDRAVELLTNLGELPGIIEWNVETSIDDRKGTIIVENALFNSLDSFEKFKNTQKHQKAGDYMRKIADWIVGDYYE